MSQSNKPRREDALDVLMKWHVLSVLFVLGVGSVWQTANRIVAGEPIEPVPRSGLLTFLTWFSMACYIWATRLLARPLFRPRDDSRPPDAP